MALTDDARKTYLTDLFLLALTVLFALALLAHAYVGYFTRYMADDYCVAGAVRNLGLLTTQKFFYQGWSGRFSFTFVAGVLALVGPRVVPFLPGIALTLMLGVLTWVGFKFVSRAQRRPLLTAFLLAEVIVLVALTDNRGGVDEALYWQTGMLTYWLPLIFMIGFIGLVKCAADQSIEVGVRKLQLALGVVLTFVAGGFSETYAALQTLALLLVLAWFLWRKAFKVIPLLGAGLLGAGLALTIVVLAPGNKVRQAHFPPHPDALKLANWSVVNACKFLFSEQNYPGTFSFRGVALLLPALIAIYLAGSIPRLTASPGNNSKLRIYLLVMLPLLAFILALACFAPAYWGMSKQPPPRAMIIPEFVLVCLLVIWSYLAGSLLRSEFIVKRGRQFPLLSGISVLLLLGVMFLSVAAMRTTMSRAARARPLALIWDRQDQQIRAARARGETDLTIPVAYNIGGTDIMTEDPTYYVNQCLADYYGVKSVTAKPSLEGLRIVTGAER